MFEQTHFYASGNTEEPPWGRCGDVCGVAAGTVGLGAAEFVTKRGYVIPCLFQPVMLLLEIDSYLRK